MLHHFHHLRFVLYHRHVGKVGTGKYQGTYAVQQHILGGKGRQEAADEAASVYFIAVRISMLKQYDRTSG